MVFNVAGDVAGLRDQLIATRRDFHRNPELSFQERRTGEIVADRLESWGWKVTRGVAETGVVGLLDSGRGGRTLMIRVDIDALPIQEPGDRAYSSLTDGVMHACGHDGHTAVGLAVGELLSRYRDSLKGQVKLIFQPAEEIMSGALRMIEEGGDDQSDCGLGVELSPLERAARGAGGSPTGPHLLQRRRDKNLRER